jgi:broad specificity phosphatase PhoE
VKLVAIFVRHGQTEANKERRFRGALNIPLDSTGKSQGYDARARVSSLLDGKPAGAAFTTSRIRSKQMADIVVGPGHHQEVKNLDPLNVGNFSGQPKNDENMKAIMHYQNNPDEKIPGGERINDYRARVNPEIMMAVHLGDETGRPSVVFGHSSTIHQVSHLFHGDHNAVKVTPGGVVGVYKTPDGRYTTKALLNESHSEQDKHMMS